jgi:hypothetical protein
LFFRGPDNRIMLATNTVKGNSVAVDKPRVWHRRAPAGK